MKPIGELVLSELASQFDEDGVGAEKRTLPELVASFSIAPDRLSDRMELVSALEDLRDRGLAEMTAPADGFLTFRPTVAGQERGSDIYRDLAATSVTVVDEDRRELTLQEVAKEYDRSLVEVAAALTDDDVYHVEPSAEWQLVGRDEEWERGRELLAEAADKGTGRALFLTGPGGIGKTTLAESIGEEFAEADIDILRVRGRGTDSEPYGIIREAIADCDSGEPVISDGGGIADDFDTFQAQQTGLFHEFTDQLTPDPAESMRFLHVDDLHRADHGTLTYISYLLERLQDERLFLLASFRPEELPADAPAVFHQEPDGSTEDPDIATIRLHPLSAAETRTVIEQTVGRRGAPDELVETVHEWTGGNPLFVEETVNLLLETGRLDPHYDGYPDDITELDLPEVVQATIDERISALDETVQRFLRIVAVVGDRVPLSVLEAVTGTPEPEVRAALTVLADAGILEWNGPDRVSIRNEVMLEGLVDDVPAAERPHLHRVIADALATVYASGGQDSDERAAQIAGHYKRAGEPEKAIEWYRRAGDHALDVYAQSTAVEHYESAIQLAQRVDDDRTVVDLNDRLAEVYFLGAEFDQADRHCQFVQERSDSPDRSQAALVMAARIANNRGEYEAAFEHTTEGLSIDDGSQRRRGELLLERAASQDHLGEFDSAIDSAEEALAIAEEIDAPELVMEAHAQLGEVAMKQNRFADGDEHLQQALDMAQQLDDQHRCARIRMALGATAHHQDDLAAFEKWNERALKDFEAVGDPHGVAKAQGNLGMLARRRGDFGEARERLQQSMETQEAVGDAHSAARDRANLANVALSQGDYGTATDHYERALDVFEEVGERREVAMARDALGFLALKRQQVETAREYLQRALELFTEIDRRNGIGNAHLGLGIADTLDGEYNSAREHLNQAHELLGDVGNRARLTTVRLALAHLDTLADSPDRGLERWNAIAEHLDSLDPSYSVEPFKRLLDACLEKQDAAAAWEWCDRTLEHFEASDGDAPKRLRAFLADHRTELGGTTQETTG